MIKFFVDPAELLQVLSRCNHIVSQSTTWKFTSMVLFEVGENFLDVTATNAVVTLRNTIGINNPAETTGSFCLPHGALKNWLSNSFVSGQNVSFEFDGNRVTAEAKRGRTSKLAYMDQDEFPAVYIPGDNEDVAKLPGKDFRDAIKSIATLADTNSYKVTKNVQFILRNKTFETIATDGIILGYQKGNQQSNAADEFLIDARSMLAISSAIGEFDTVRLYKRERESSDVIFFSGPRAYVYTQIQRDIRFPDIKPLMAEDHPNKVTLNKDELRRAMLASRGFSKTEDFNPVYVTFFPDSDSIQVSAVETELGGNTDVIENVQYVEGSYPMTIKVNVEMWLNALSRIDGMRIWIHYDEDENGLPKRLHITDTMGNQKFIVAPMREVV